ncbi:hypothetical protein B0H16DRAFT_1490400 [Mycena metata]|uniref:MD-2-related lipid-recognition domain-containing protein n=1 Tax=Mycena metata TaxID=1033252 RepID=A0AAD7P399_9AGAR|nr:hypothetical protein B0H16DRAFT_1490400 [Mycena metata]
MSRLSTIFLLLSLSFFSVILQVHAAGWEYTDCGSPSNPIQIDSIELLPDPPLPGQDLTVKVKALVTDTIEEGASANVVLLQKTFDVCEEARNVNASVSCPQTIALPKEIPKAKFVVLVRGFTVAEEDMLCLDLKIDFMKSLSEIFNSPF